MIGRISGTLISKNPPQVLVDVQGVGYEIDVPMSTFYDLPEVGRAVSYKNPGCSPASPGLAKKQPND